jgi:hypothetical protein
MNGLVGVIISIVPRRYIMINPVRQRIFLRSA